MSDENKGQVMTTWIPSEESWILDAIDECQCQFAARGFEISKSQIVRTALADQLDSFREPARAKSREDCKSLFGST